MIPINAQGVLKKLDRHAGPVLLRNVEAPFADPDNGIHRAGGICAMKDRQKVCVVKTEPAIVILPPLPAKDNTAIVKNALVGKEKTNVRLRTDGSTLIDGKKEVTIAAGDGLLLYYDGEEWLTI